MSSEDTKKQLNVRISEPVMDLIDRATYRFRRTKVQIVEEAIVEYAAKRCISERYQLNVKNGMAALIKIDGSSTEIVEVGVLNGVSAEDMARAYSSRFNQEVPLVVDKK